MLATTLRFLLMLLILSNNNSFINAFSRNVYHLQHLPFVLRTQYETALQYNRKITPKNKWVNFNVLYGESSHILSTSNDDKDNDSGMEDEDNYGGVIQDYDSAYEIAGLPADADMIKAMRLERIIANDRWQSCLIRDQQGGEWTGMFIISNCTHLNHELFLYLYLFFCEVLFILKHSFVNYFSLRSVDMLSYIIPIAFIISMKMMLQEFFNTTIIV